MTLKEIAKEEKVSITRIHYIEHRALKKLRNNKYIKNDYL
jgi:DNA-directed RNA polymerase sigma subunit (sigma70/sigma32)